MGRVSESVRAVLRGTLLEASDAAALLKLKTELDRFESGLPGRVTRSYWWVSPSTALSSKMDQAVKQAAQAAYMELGTAIQRAELEIADGKFGAEDLQDFVKRAKPLLAKLGKLR
jgi:hypothetical protein